MSIRVRNTGKYELVIAFPGEVWRTSYVEVLVRNNATCFIRILKVDARLPSIGAVFLCKEIATVGL